MVLKSKWMQPLSWNIDIFILFPLNHYFTWQSRIATHNSHIFLMDAISLQPAVKGAHWQRRLVAFTHHVVHEYRSRTLAVEFSTRSNLYGFRVTQLSTDHVGVQDIPWVVADCTPLATVFYFYSTLIGWWSTNQAHRRYNNGRPCCSASCQTWNIMVHQKCN